MQTGINTAVAGNRIEATAGTYDVNLNWTSSGTATEPITLESYGGVAILHAAASSSEILRVTGGFKRIKGLKIEATPTLWTGTGRQPFYISGVGGAHDIDVIGNDLAGYDAGTTTGHDITAFLVGPGATNINIVGNRCHDWGNGSTQRQCLYIQADSGMVANNVVYHDPHGFGIQVRADTSTVKTCAVIVTGNTVVDVPYASTAGGRGIYVENNCSGVRLRNNISAFSLNGQQELYGLYGSGSDPPASMNRAFTNLAWDTSTTRCGNTSGHLILDFSDGQGVYTSCGTQNLEADPLFVDRAGFDYHLNAGSAAIDRADPDYALPFDFDGNPRNGAPDLGAFER
jgi:hypothetical protein